MNTRFGCLAMALTVAACTEAPPEPSADTGAGGDGTTGTTTSTGAGNTATGAGGASDGEGGRGGMGGSPAGGIGLDCSQAQHTLLCDDFEGGAIDDTLWSTVKANGGSVTVDSTNAYDGQYALHVSLPSQDGARGFLRAKNALFPLPDNSMFGRAYFYATPQVPDTHSKTILLSGPLDGSTAQYRLDSNSRRLNSRYTTPYIDEHIQHGGLRKMGDIAPKNRWVCIEWHYDGTNNEMRYWIDGVFNSDMEVLQSETPPWLAPTFERFEIGWQTYQAGENANHYDFFFDSIVIDDERIGCGT